MYYRKPLTDVSGLEPEKCPNCGNGPTGIHVLDAFEVRGIHIPSAGVTFDHRRRGFHCGQCRHEWNMDRVVNFSH
jgi:hypothetical protein